MAYINYPLARTVIICTFVYNVYSCNYRMHIALTHWGGETHICVGKLTIIASDNGLSPGRRQAIIWTDVRILLIGPLGTNFNEILIEIHTFSFKKMRLKMSSAKWRSFCLGLSVLITGSGPLLTKSYHKISWRLSREIRVETFPIAKCCRDAGNISTLKPLIQKQLLKGKKCLCALSTLLKTFNRVNRHILFYKLLK